MEKSQIAAQLYTLRDFLRTPADIAASLKKVKSLGFEAVQISGMGPIAERELNRILAGEGLLCCATHEKGVTIIEDVNAVIDRLNELNCRYTAFPSPYERPTDYAEALALAKKLNASAEAMAAAGQVLCYHNHALEFERFDGQLMLDIFYDNAPALQAELDTFWVQAGGGNPVEWVKKFPGRQPLLHLKDFGMVNNERVMERVGFGNLDWREIIPAAEAAGVKYFIIEQDVCRKDPFESLRDSLNYLLSNFVN